MLLVTLLIIACLQLSFENDRGGLHPVKIDTLRALLSAGGPTLDFVFVSACHRCVIY